MSDIAKRLASIVLPYAGVEVFRALEGQIDQALKDAGEAARADERERLSHQSGYLVRGE